MIRGPNSVVEEVGNLTGSDFVHIRKDGGLDCDYIFVDTPNPSGDKTRPLQSTHGQITVMLRQMFR